MKSDFEGMNDLLKKDLERYSKDFKDTLIPMLELGLEEKLKDDLIRVVHSLKALAGMFELHDISDFIYEVEVVVSKIFELNRKDISNDILNDLFVIRDRFQFVFEDYLGSSNALFCNKIKDENKRMLAELSKHYIDYKNNQTPILNKQPSQVIDTKTVVANNVKAIEQSAPNGEYAYVVDNVMYLCPNLLNQLDVVQFQEFFVANIANVKHIKIDLGSTSMIDLIGIQFVQSIKKHCKVSGVKFEIISQSASVINETHNLGVEL